MSNPHDTSARAKGDLQLTYSLADQSFSRTKSLGILNFSLQLLRALQRHPKFTKLTVLGNQTLKTEVPAGRGISIAMHDEAAGGGLGRVWWDQVGVYSAASDAGNEWLFLPKGFAPFLRGKSPARLAVFIHDLMHFHYAQHHPGGVPRFEAFYFKQSLHASLAHAEIVFTQTDFVKREVENYARSNGLRTPRIVCCGRGFERPSMLNLGPGPHRDVLVLASRQQHKLTPLAVERMVRWQEQHKFAGEVQWVGALPDGLALPALPNWRHHPRLPEAEYQTMIRRAAAIVYFTDYEGFGLPPVEAALVGACPVYSEVAATREVMGGRGCPFDNASEGSFFTAMERALVTPSSQIALAAEELLARYDWDKTVARIAEALVSR